MAEAVTAPAPPDTPSPMPAKKPAPVGRPRSGEAPRYPRAIRVYPADDDEHDAITEAAAKAGLSVSAWMLEMARARLKSQ